MLVELDRGGVANSDLQVDLGASQLEKMLLRSLHQAPADTSALMLRVDREVVDPTAVPVVPSHHRTDDVAPESGDEERRIFDGEVAVDVEVGIVP